MTTNPRNMNRELFNSLTFGIEIETFGTTGIREKMARMVAAALGGYAEYKGTYYRTWTAIDSAGRKWDFMTDSSVHGGDTCEVVSPVLRWADIDTLQTVIRTIRKAGGRVNDSCGIHIHVGAQSFNVKAITNLLKLVFKQENIMYRALNIEHRTRWASRIGENGCSGSLMSKVNAGKIKSLDDLNKAFYGRSYAYDAAANHDHYHSARYQGVNLHNLWYKTGNARTVEFRHFAPSLDGRDKVHAGQVKAYVAFVLALATKAIDASRASGKERRDVNPSTLAYDWRVFLVCTLGLKGDEFKNARKWLMSRVDGDSGYRNGRTQRDAATTPATAADTVVGCTPENFAAANAGASVECDEHVAAFVAANR